MESNQNSNIRDPLSPSYPQSAARFLPYRIGIVVLAIGLIMVGKSNLPSDQVNCIEDVILQFLTPITSYFLNQQIFGRIIITFLHLLVDIQLLAGLIYWFLYGKSMRYPIVLAIIGISKVMLNFLFRTKTIPNSFISPGYIPSIIFGENFVNSYFFSGVAALMTIHLLELIQLNKNILWKIQAGILILVSFMLLAFKLNFFMDIATGIVYAHLIYRNILSRELFLDNIIISNYQQIIKKISPQQSVHQQSPEHNMKQMHPA